MSVRRAFTLLDLLFLLIIGVLLLGQFFVLHRNSHESVVRVKCASNLRQIGQAMLLYASENKGAYPRTRWDPSLPAPTQYTGASASNPFSPDGPDSNDVTAAIFLLLRTQEIDSEVFICPHTPLDRWELDPNFVSPAKWSNFADGRHLSYSIANPYPDQVAVKAGYHWDNMLTADLAVAADMNPGGAHLLNLTPTSLNLAVGNSANHGGEGQCVLFGDGHAEWVTTCFVGFAGDNIYTRHAGDGMEIIGPPADANDSILLPIATVNPGVPIFVPPRSPVLLILLISIGGLMGLWIIFRLISYLRHRSSSVKTVS